MADAFKDIGSKANEAADVIATTFINAVKAAGIQVKDIVDQATRLEDEITAKVPEDIAALFRQYATTCSEINDVSCLEDFKSGVRLAVRFMLAALDDERGDYGHNNVSE